MECKYCGAPTKVTDSRKRYGTVYRRRKCTACNKNFWTSEEPADKNEIKQLMKEYWINKKLKQLNGGQNNG